jgi:hypothetical protein
MLVRTRQDLHRRIRRVQTAINDVDECMDQLTRSLLNLDYDVDNELHQAQLHLQDYQAQSKHTTLRNICDNMHTINGLYSYNKCVRI